MFSLCRTTEGYSERAVRQVTAVSSLAQKEAWTSTVCDDDWDGAREVADVVRQTCERVRKGKGRRVT